MNKGVFWTVLNDILMNLIAAFMLLLVAANFSPTTTFPFKLISTEKATDAGVHGCATTTDIQITKPVEDFIIRVGESSMPFDEATKCIERINPHLPARIAVENGCGFTVEKMAVLMQLLKNKGVTNVAIVTETPA